VDNAIVVAEAAARYKGQGLPAFEAARRGTDEVAGPLTAGTLTTLLVFGPIVFVQGLAAALFRDLSLSVVMSVGASLVLALTLMPVMIARRQQVSAVTRRLTPLLRLGHTLAELYEDGMRWSLRRPRTVFAIAIGLTALTVFLGRDLPREILPRVDEGIVVAELKLPEGTAIEETARQVGRIEQAATGLGSSGIYSRIGIATDEEVLAGADPGTSATAQLLIPAPPGKNAARLAERVRQAVPDLARGSLAMDLAGQSEFGSLIGRAGRTVRVEVSAPKLDEAARWGDTLRASLAGIATLTDVRDAYASSQPTVEITLDRDRIARLGVSTETVANALAGGLGGVSSGEYRETDRRTPITVRFAGNANEDLATALATSIKGVPLGQLVTAKDLRARPRPQEERG
jgi:HAE1 family hydrophobic/amphiphilic exporter-1